MLLTASDLNAVFTVCIDILSMEFNIAGIKVSLLAFIIFDIVAVLLLSAVLSLFHK